MEMAARPMIAHAINTRHVFVYARVNGGNGSHAPPPPAPPLSRRTILKGGTCAPGASPGWFVALAQLTTGAAVTMPTRLITRQAG